jgi:hypothetical protein
MSAASCEDKGDLVVEEKEEVLADGEKAPDFGRFNDKKPDQFDRLEIGFDRHKM